MWEENYVSCKFCSTFGISSLLTSVVTSCLHDNVNFKEKKIKDMIALMIVISNL